MSLEADAMYLEQGDGQSLILLNSGFLYAHPSLIFVILPHHKADEPWQCSVLRHRLM